MGTETTPYDPKPKKNAENLEEIKNSLKKPHWSQWAMLIMTFVILLLTLWMAFPQGV